jgi:hypothetical protein
MADLAMALLATDPHQKDRERFETVPCRIIPSLSKGIEKIKMFGATDEHATLVTTKPRGIMSK